MVELVRLKKLNAEIMRTTSGGGKATRKPAR
jgi:hypothetical protein